MTKQSGTKGVGQWQVKVKTVKTRKGSVRTFATRAELRTFIEKEVVEKGTYDLKDIDYVIDAAGVRRLARMVAAHKRDKYARGDAFAFGVPVLAVTRYPADYERSHERALFNEYSFERIASHVQSAEHGDLEVVRRGDYAKRANARIAQGKANAALRCVCKHAVLDHDKAGFTKTEWKAVVRNHRRRVDGVKRVSHCRGYGCFCKGLRITSASRKKADAIKRQAEREVA